MDGAPAVPQQLARVAGLVLHCGGVAVALAGVAPDVATAPYSRRCNQLLIAPFAALSSSDALRDYAARFGWQLAMAPVPVPVDQVTPTAPQFVLAAFCGVHVAELAAAAAAAAALPPLPRIHRG